jgi:integrase-like protein
MRDLNYELKQLCRRNRDGSYATQVARERILTLIANQLHEMGFRNMTAQSLKPKHVEALVERWKGEELSTGTLKNRMVELRWWAEKAGKENVVARSNDSYGIADRQLVSSANKARELTPLDVSKVADPYTRTSLKLQAAFGLRREESIKIRPVWSDRGDRLVLKASWTNGRAREIPIRTDGQRQALAAAKEVAGRGSLIPTDKSYVQQLKRYEDQCAKAGIHRAHGHRHAYAQTRYFELTGRQAPAIGGLRSRDLTVEQKREDREVRLIISAELGHEREQITAVYLGR